MVFGDNSGTVEVAERTFWPLCAGGVQCFDALRELFKVCVAVDTLIADISVLKRSKAASQQVTLKTFGSRVELGTLTPDQPELHCTDASSIILRVELPDGRTFVVPSGFRQPPRRVGSPVLDMPLPADLGFGVKVSWTGLQLTCDTPAPVVKIDAYVPSPLRTLALFNLLVKPALDASLAYVDACLGDVRAAYNKLKALLTKGVLHAAAAKANADLVLSCETCGPLLVRMQAAATDPTVHLPSRVLLISTGVVQGVNPSARCCREECVAAAKLSAAVRRDIVAVVERIKTSSASFVTLFKQKMTLGQGVGRQYIDRVIAELEGVGIDTKALRANVSALFASEKQPVTRLSPAHVLKLCGGADDLDKDTLTTKHVVLELCAAALTNAWAEVQRSSLAARLRLWPSHPPAALQKAADVLGNLNVAAHRAEVLMTKLRGSLGCAGGVVPVAEVMKEGMDAVIGYYSAAAELRAKLVTLRRQCDDLGSKTALSSVTGAFEETKRMEEFVNRAVIDGFEGIGCTGDTSKCRLSPGVAGDYSLLRCDASGRNHVSRLTPPVPKPTPCPIRFESVGFVGPVTMLTARPAELAALHDEEDARTPTTYRKHADGRITCSTCEALARRFADADGSIPRMVSEKRAPHVWKPEKPDAMRAIAVQASSTPVYTAEQQEAQRAMILTVLGAQLTPVLLAQHGCGSCKKTNNFSVSADGRSIVCGCSAPLVVKTKPFSTSFLNSRFSACALCGCTNVAEDPRAGHTACLGCGSVVADKALDGGQIRHLADEDNAAKVHYEWSDPTRITPASTMITDGASTEYAQAIRASMAAADQAGSCADLDDVEKRDTREWYKQRMVDAVRDLLDKFPFMPPAQRQFALAVFQSRRVVKQNMADIAGTIAGAVLMAKHLYVVPDVAMASCPDCGEAVIAALLHVPGRHTCKLEDVKDEARRAAIADARQTEKKKQRAAATRRRRLNAFNIMSLGEAASGKKKKETKKRDGVAAPELPPGKRVRCK